MSSRPRGFRGPRSEHEGAPRGKRSDAPAELVLVWLPPGDRAVLPELEALAGMGCFVLDGPFPVLGRGLTSDARRLRSAVDALEGGLRSAAVREGLARAQAAGARLGRPPRYTPRDAAAVVRERAKGASWGEIGRRLGMPKRSARRLARAALEVPSKRRTRGGRAPR